MRNIGMRKLRYLMYALLLFALTGCGASTLGTASNAGPGSISAKLVWGESKSTAKTVASAPAGITSIQVTIAGTGADGKAIPVVRGIIDATSNQGTIGGIYPGTVTLAVKALSGTTVSYEGYAIGVVVNAGATTTIADPIVMSPPIVKAENAPCINCHETTLDKTGQNLVADYKQSGHYTNTAWTTNVNGATQTGCAGCHGTQHNVADPAKGGRCNDCHNAVSVVAHNGDSTTSLQSNGFVNNCNTCHNAHNSTQFVGAGCTVCHAVGQNANSDKYVNDNTGVRAITTEFGKWSHHVTGVTLNDAHCAACHLEGRISNGKVVVDTTKHMVDAKTHLRDTTANTDADFAWDPAAPNHTGMDNYCMSCHDANGAVSPMSAQIQKFINDNGLAATGKTASATNPFGDTISNQYDKLERPAVIDAASQFATGNNSHHAVLGKKYTGRSRVSKGGTIADAAFTANSSATLPGARSTIYDAGRFESTYVTLQDAAGETGARNGGTTLGDDSTLHCGDCHTVGQYRAADVNVKPFNQAVIGAHGSNNEYLLRNYAGTDQRHVGQRLDSAGLYIATGPYLVCFNCHKLDSYGNGHGHDGERAGSEQCNGPYNTRSEPTGISNLVSSLTPVVNPPYTGVGEDRLMSVITRVNGTTAGSYGAQTTGHGGMLGNIYGIQCANCHNSGPNNGFGGIHGSKVQTYTDGLGNTTKVRRFLPGLGNVMFVPGTVGGYTGGTTATYKSYSGNRNGTGTGNTVGQTFTLLPVRDVPFKAGNKVGSFTYTTGGITNDLNWEQKTAGLDNGSMSATQGPSGCYTLQVKGVINSHGGFSGLQSNGYPADDVRYAPADGLKAVDGQELLDTWGGCEDHGGVAGRSSEPFTRGIVRPVTY